MRDDADEVDGLWFDKQREVGAGDVFGREGGAAGDGAKSGVGVLEVGTCIAFKGCHDIQIEGVVVDSIYVSTGDFVWQREILPLSSHILNHYTGNT